MIKIYESVLFWNENDRCWQPASLMSLICDLIVIRWCSLIYLSMKYDLFKNFNWFRLYVQYIEKKIDNILFLDLLFADMTLNIFSINNIWSRNKQPYGRIGEVIKWTESKREKADLESLDSRIRFPPLAETIYL
jgi:hypothetical protein